MSEKLKPVRCGCGGEANVMHPSYTHCIVVMCGKCGIKTPYMNTEAEAIEAWNRAMSGSAEEKLKAFWDGMSAEMRAERTAKVVCKGTTMGLSFCCGNCGKPVHSEGEYCHHCGAKLDWGEA